MATSFAPELPVEGKTVKALTSLAAKRTRELFAGNFGESLPLDVQSQQLKIRLKLAAEYDSVQHLVAPAPAPGATAGPGSADQLRLGSSVGAAGQARPESRSATAKLIDSVASQPRKPTASEASQQTLVLYNKDGVAGAGGSLGGGSAQRAIMKVIEDQGSGSAAVSRRLASKWPRPEWRAPWKMYRVISGHLGAVRSVAVDHGNEWFVTGSADRTIKIWDLASGQLRLTLTGHIEQVTGLAVSPRHPYMFSCGLDKLVKCWDLEYNKVIRAYHGHLSGVYSLALHPTLDVHCLSGHTQTVCSILAQPTDPQVVTGSHDSTIRTWDLRTGKTSCTLTYHKKAVRALAAHPSEHAFASASAENIKKFKLPDGEFLHNMLQQQKAIVNAMAINDDGVMVSGGDNGSMWWWDWRSGHCFQQGETIVQPGSLDSEANIYSMSYDMTGSRLITCEGDKTIKLWKEDESATPSTHPILPYRPPKDIRRY
ncbi:MAG: hypothetical protein WDW38_007074 [Sanguina aurantia]